VVAGAVIADRRHMGIMKSIGFTPGQITAVLVTRVLIPVAIGAAIGIPLGSLAAGPFLQKTAEALGLPALFADGALVDLGVLATCLAVSLAASIWPAARAGRMSAVAAIAIGAGPSTSRGGEVIAGLGRLRLRPALRLGLAMPAARPIRAAMTGLAVLIGVAIVVFVFGLTISLQLVAASLSRVAAVQVVAQTAPGRTGSDMASVIGSATGTARFVAEGQTKVSMPGVASPVSFYAYQGDSAWTGFALISGRWFAGPGEVVAQSHLVDMSGLRIGHSFTATLAGRSQSLTLVGEIFDQTGDDLLLRGSWSDLAQLDPQAAVDR
jgi:putative ABC transport system permease protein